LFSFGVLIRSYFVHPINGDDNDYVVDDDDDGGDISKTN
jgi:hypothetical protein